MNHKHSHLLPIQVSKQQDTNPLTFKERHLAETLLFLKLKSNNELFSQQLKGNWKQIFTEDCTVFFY